MLILICPVIVLLAFIVFVIVAECNIAEVEKRRKYNLSILLEKVMKSAPEAMLDGDTLVDFVKHNDIGEGKSTVQVALFNTSPDQVKKLIIDIQDSGLLVSFNSRDTIICYNPNDTNIRVYCNLYLAPQSGVFPLIEKNFGASVVFLPSNPEAYMKVTGNDHVKDFFNRRALVWRDVLNIRNKDLVFL